MADSSPPVRLWDRARKAFGLASDFASWLKEADQPVHDMTGFDEIHRNAMGEMRRRFGELVAAVLECAPLVASQDGSTEVASAVRALAEWTAKWDAKTDSDPTGQSWTLLSGEWPELNTFVWNGHKAIEAAENPSKRDRWKFLEESQTGFTLLDRYPATPAGHVAFLEFVRDEVHYTADAKRSQLERGYSNATIESMVRGIKWAEALTRVAALSTLREGVRANVSDILHRELTAGTVEQIDILLTPAVWGVRNSLEDARQSDLTSKMVPVATAGDLWKALAEGKRPCYQCSGIVSRPGANIQTQTCADATAEARRMALNHAQALVTAEGGDKAVAMEKLIARVQLQMGMDKASVINMPLVDFVAAAMGRGPARDGRAENIKSGEGDLKERLPKAEPLTDATQAPAPTTNGLRRRGRRKADYETAQREAQLAADWERAREAGVYKGDFAKERGTTIAKLDALLDRVAKRKRTSE
jgi:hypothetical protein